ncbi:hypothetical protein O159_24790 [Leifsonia xyli subsp. cynodontis DSM 46306]|uniref:Bacterial sugar transferase domain-containing protein n=1 Tax=Leifsonia xyli subsp. cynodontis DSM 46306 TaxID=1389489 RepID=U3P812_LEIXC|nr:sugar transferase [Leifsonia xyli]AGW42415.1 hypothetical protein O159_24790 [Leifsonia xyli subsp. cynodontis DSM 46306]
MSDTAIVLAVTVGAMLLRFGFDESGEPVAEFLAHSLTISLVIALAWLSMLTLYHTHDLRVVGVDVSEYKRVVNATALTFSLLAILFLLAKADIGQGSFIVALPAGTVCVLLSRWLWRRWLIRHRVFGHYLSRALVVGGLRDVDYVVDRIEKASGATYKVVGVALDTGKRTGSRKREALSRTISTKTQEVPIVSDLDGVAPAAARLGADTVIVAGRARGDGDFVRELSWKLEGTATSLVLASPLTDVAGPRIRFRPVEGLPLIQVEIPQFEGGKHLLKRAFDIVSAAFGLLLLTPLFAVIALLVKLEDGGPVFFSQERVGRGGESFRMFKFRSMAVDAEAELAGLRTQDEGNGVLFKMKHDPRVTRLGAVLRRFSLDELPQLLNVFLGDMSLVGPRPPLPSEAQGYENHVHRRLFIKPGLTGMWQINGRSDLSWEESVRLDLYYVENWSLLGDLVIVWRTLRVLLHPAGAY